MMDSSKIVFKWWWVGSKKIEKTNDVVYGWHLWWTGKDPPRFDSISYLARKREAKITFMHFLLEYLCMYIHILLSEKAAIPAKGQLISKGLFGILNSSKNRTKTIRFFIRFLEELKTPESFWNQLTFSCALNIDFT